MKRFQRTARALGGSIILVALVSGCCFPLPGSKKKPSKEQAPTGRLAVGTVAEVTGKTFLCHTREDLDGMASSFRDVQFVTHMKAQGKAFDLAKGSRLKILEKEDVLGGIQVEVVSGNLPAGTRGFVSVFCFNDW